jgi:hypothetical protein
MGFNLSDLDALQKREIKTVPLCFFDLERSLGLLGNLLGVILGNDHVITIHYRQFWSLLSHSLRDELRDHVDIQSSIRPAHILRSVQLVIHSWFAARRLNLLPPPPPFVDILFRIQMASYQLPTLPGIYHKLTYATKAPSGTPTTSLSSSTAGSSDLSTLSDSIRQGPAQTVMGHSVRPAPASTNTKTFVRNPDPDATLQALIPAHLQLRNVIQSDTVPLNDAGHPMCLSYHLRRGCWSQCKRAQDHGRQLSGAERQRVVNFVSAQLRKLAAVHPPPSILAIPTGASAVSLPPAPPGTTQGSIQGAASSRG